MSRIEFEAPRLGELRRQVPEDTLALTIEGSYLQALGRRGTRVRWWARVPLPEGTLRAGHVVDENQITRCTQQLLNGMDKRGMRIVLVMPTFMATWNRYTLLGNIPKRDLEGVMLQEQRRLFPSTGADYTLRGVIGGGGKEPWQIYSVTVPKESLYNFVRGVVDAGFQPKVVNLRALAIFEAGGQPTCVCVDAGRNSIEVGVLQNGIPLVIRTKHLGSDEIDPNYYQGTLDDEVQRALAPISKVVDQGGFPPQAPVVLSGEMVVRHPDMDLQQLLKKTTGRSVMQPDPGVSLPVWVPSGGRSSRGRSQPLALNA